MNPTCYICNKEFSPGTACAKCQHIAERWDALNKRLNKAESIAYHVEQKIQTIQHILGEQFAVPNENISVPRSLIEDLLETIMPDYHDKFTTDNILYSHIVCDAADLLRTKGTDKWDKVWNSLRYHLYKWYDYHGYDKAELKEGRGTSRNIWNKVKDE